MGVDDILIFQFPIFYTFRLAQDSDGEEVDGCDIVLWRSMMATGLWANQNLLLGKCGLYFFLSILVNLDFCTVLVHL